MSSRSQSFHFPYKKLRTDIGVTPYPFVQVQILKDGKTVNSDFLVDTGADVATLPSYMAQELGIDLHKLGRSKSQGVGEGLVDTWETKIKIRIRDVEFKIRCTFVASNKIPPLLGKLDFFSEFNLYFDNEREELRLDRR